MKLPPAFQFYPKDWLSSASVSVMTLEQQAAYFNLLCHEWLEPDCGLPLDENELAKLSKLGKKWNKSRERIMRQFERLGDRYFNARLVEERQKQMEYAEKSAAAGKKGADKRWGGHDLAMATPIAKNSSAVCSLQSASPKEEPLKPPAPKTGADTNALAVVPPVKAKPGKRAKRTVEQIRAALGDQRLPWWEHFWKVFPCHEGLNPAMDAFERVIHTHDLAADVYRGAQAYAARARADPTIRLKYGQGWINEERWLDENKPQPANPGNQAALERQFQFLDVLRSIE